MKYVDEFRNRYLVGRLARKIEAAARGQRYNFMEVCGTHTMNIFRFGLKDLLPDNIRLISGPGCPVCVTPNKFIDKAIALAGMKNIMIATFGDMLKVPGSRSSLEKARSDGAKVKIVYSTADALSLARRNRDRQIIFLGVGFETTTPTIAQSIVEARKEGLENYSVLCGHKTMPEALEALVKDEDLNIDGFLLPGHVSAIIGARPYGFLSSEYGKRCVIAGFEPVDILQAILMLVNQKRPKIEIQYTRIIDRRGNALAKRIMKKVFEKTDSEWRGMGSIKNSGLRIRKKFSAFDAEAKFRPRIPKPVDNKGCICGKVLKGAATPPDCGLFGKACTPEKPVGACMVSSEGTCAAYYKYRVQKNG